MHLVKETNGVTGILNKEIHVWKQKHSHVN